MAYLGSNLIINHQPYRGLIEMKTLLGVSSLFLIFSMFISTSWCQVNRQVASEKNPANVERLNKIVAPIIKSMQSPNPDLRRKALGELSQVKYQNPQIWQAFSNMLKDENEEIRKSAASIINGIIRHSTTNGVVDAKKDFLEYLRWILNRPFLLRWSVFLFQAQDPSGPYYIIP